MGQQPEAFTPPETEINIFDLARVALGNKWIILACTLIGFLLSSFWLYTHPPEFVARVVFKPLAREDQMDPRTSSSGSLAGRLFGTETDQSIALYISTIYSVEMIERAIQKRDLAQLVMPHLWNAETREWEQPTGTMASINRAARRLFGRAETIDPKDPTVILAALDNLVTFDPLIEKLTPSTVKMEVRSRDPEQALAILKALHEEALSYIREKKEIYISGMLRSMKSRYAETSERAYREAFLQQIMSLEKRLIMLRGEDYAIVELIDPPAIASPPLAMPLALGLLLGLVGGALLGMTVNVGLFSRRLLQGVKEDLRPVTRPAETTVE